jgi:adenine/guanine/hypoxanthine permease
VWYALITILYVDILDTPGTLYSTVYLVILDFEHSTAAQYCIVGLRDTFSISMGALMGMSPVTASIKNATGKPGT